LYSTCLDVPTSLSMAASRTSGPVGASVIFTATLGTDGVGRLSNNLVSSRVVVLQQRLSTGWSDVTRMAAGSSAGTYTASVVISTRLPGRSADCRGLPVSSPPIT
jgi:hypothetical protein